MSDGLVLAEAVERLHPDPFRSVSREQFFATAERAETAVELMGLLALLGERNGHTAVHPLDPHLQPLHAFPIGLYEFDDGVFVIAAADSSLVGCELVAVGGVPFEELNRAVEPLVARDNESTVRARRPRYAVTQEVLRGLGVTDEPATFELRRPSGERHAVKLRAIAAAEHNALVAHDRPPRSLETVGSALHIAYNVTRGDTTAFAREIEAASAGLDRLVLDLRYNGGGNNQTYGPLLGVLERLASGGKRLAVLISRVTFSAAMQLVVDLEQRTPAVFVGEPTGGSPNQYGDAVPVELPGAGLTARVATVSWTTAGEDDERATKEPDVYVPLTAVAFFAGDDPVLRAALDA
jgi:C-terminal processing protease CtpA/Prc